MYPTAVPPTVIWDDGEPTIIGIRGRDIILTFRITRASPGVDLDDILWTYQSAPGEDWYMTYYMEWSFNATNPDTYRCTANYHCRAQK